MRGAGLFSDRFVRERDQSVVEEDRLDVPDPPPLDVDVLVACALLRRTLRFVEHGYELRRIEMPLVEEALCRLDDRGDDARLGHDSAHRADGAVAGPLRDLPNLELQSRRACECDAPLVHGRRAGVRGLAAKGDLVTLDA